MERRKRKYQFYELTIALCSTCLKRVEGKVVIEDHSVYLMKWCSEHGREKVLLADDAEYWRWAREAFMTEAEMPMRFQTPQEYGCPYDCGLCPDHQQHNCLVVLEVGDTCNMKCPICYADSGPHRQSFRSMEQIESMLDSIVAAEGEPDIVQISGGEPTIHPQFWEILDAAKARPIRHLMVNTNGIMIAKDPEFAKRLATYLPGIEVYLQFDSFREEVNQEIRGQETLKFKMKALDNLDAAGLSTTLVVTLKKGRNLDEIGDLISFGISRPCVRGLTFQPVQEAGRVDDYDASTQRLTLTEVRREIAAQSEVFTLADLIPVPCHPDALCMAYGLKLAGQVHSLTRYVDPESLVEGSTNTVLFEQIPGLKDTVANLYSTGLGPDQQATRLGKLLCCLPEVEAPGLTYDNVFRLMIMKFSDARDLTVRSIKRSCVQIADPSGKLIPFDTYNLLYRGALQEKLETLRGSDL